VAVRRYGVPLVPGLVVLEELGCKVGDQLCDLLAVPLVLALVVVNRILPACKKLADRPTLAVDFPGLLQYGRHGLRPAPRSDRAIREERVLNETMASCYGRSVGIEIAMGEPVAGVDFGTECWQRCLQRGAKSLRENGGHERGRR
jgi:hypothetical protein